MGVIAVAVYPEVRRFDSMAELAAPMAPMPFHPAKKAKKSAEAGEAGTGYGRPEYSPARTVAFEPEENAAERIYIKYEWRSTLCRLGIIPPEKAVRPHRNRLWDNGGFAPPPPGRG